MSRILLVSTLRNYHMNNEMYPSGALLLLGSLLRKHGHTVKVAHMVADKVSVERFTGILQEFHPSIVGFTVSTYQTKYTKIISRQVKEFNVGIVTVAGGAHPTALGMGFLNEFPDIDILVYGEGEMAFLDIAKGIPLVDIKGIYFRSNQHLIPTGTSQLITNIDDFPLPDKSLINFKAYSGLFPVGKRPSMFIMSSRGCPYKCTFCSKSIYGNTLRLRSPGNIMEEVELLYKDWGVREIHFGDDTFNANRKWANDLLDLIINRGYNKKLSFRVALRVNESILDMELLKHLKSAGVWFVYYGVENGNQDMLDHMCKGITIPEVKRAFALTHSINIKTEAFFIVGMPGESVQTIRDSYNLYKAIKPFWGGFSRAMPFPGTKFTEEVGLKNHLLSVDYDNFTPSSMVVRTDTMTSNELEYWVRILNRMADMDKMKHPKQLMYALIEKAKK